MSERTCSVEGCDKPQWRREWCGGHYHRWLRYGDVGGSKPRVVRQPLKWLESAVRAAVLSDDDSCLLDWPYERNEWGYCRLWDGRRRYAHIVVLELTGRPKPSPGMQARHTCGNGSLGCLHPRHLLWGTAAENNADKIAHGTSGKGEAHSQARLTEADVRAIRVSSDSRRITALKYGVSEGAIQNIRSRRTWEWLTP